MAQNGNHADRPGHYQTVVTLDSAVVPPGSALSGSVFLSGYGHIENAKFFFVGPENIGQGKWHTGFGWEQTADGGQITQGANESEASYALVFQFTAAVRMKGRPLLTPFSDSNPDIAGSSILSEKYNPKPPASFSYQIPEHCPPGNYKLTTVFTYFNGQTWSTDRLETPYTVSSLFQRHEGLVAGIALAAAVSTIIAAVITIVAASGSAMSAVFSALAKFGG